METDSFVLCIRDPTNQLVAAECHALTGADPAADGVAFATIGSGALDAVTHAAYIGCSALLLARGNTLAELTAALAGRSWDLEGFRLDIERLGAQSRHERRDLIVAVADAIKGCSPDLNAPRHRLLIVERDTELLCGQILATPARSYRLHDDKPFRTSASLPSRLARALVNLARPHVGTVLNLCCGTGSILLEAGATGLPAAGCDSNPRMAGMSQKNVEHFGYTARVEKMDVRDWEEGADAVITDLPYGRTLEVKPDDLRGILAHARGLAPLGVFVAGEDLGAWLRQAGYARVEIFEVPKYTGFTRYVHRAWAE